MVVGPSLSVFSCKTPWSIKNTLPLLWLDANSGCEPVVGRTFVGASAQSLYTGASTDFNGLANTDFWCSCWAKCASYTDDATIFCTGAPGIIFRLYNTSGDVEARYYDGTTTFIRASAGTPLAGGNWAHFLVTVDRDGGMILYRNGTAGNPVDVSAGAARTWNAQYGLMRIGALNATGNPFTGSVACVLWGRGSLPTPSEIAELATYPRVSLLSSGLRAKITHGWNLEGTGNEADAIGSLTATVLNGPIGVATWTSALSVSEAGGVPSWTSRGSASAAFGQTAAASVPSYYGTVANGRPAISLDGAAGHLSKSAAVLSATGTTARLVAAVKSDLTGEQVVYSQSDEGTADQYLKLGISANRKIWYKFNNGGTADELEGDVELVAASWHVLEWWVTSGGAIGMAVDGLEQTLTVVGGANNGNWFGDVSDVDNAIVGAAQKSDGVSGYMDGYVAELVAFEPDVATTVSARVSSFLRGKYGVSVPFYALDGVEFSYRADAVVSQLVVTPPRRLGTTSWRPCGHDAYRGRVLGCNGSLDFSGDATKLYYSADGSTGVEIADISDAVFTSGGFTANRFCSVVALDNGDYLLCVGGNLGSQGVSDTVPCSRIYRSDDGGASWSCAAFTHPTGVLHGGSDLYAATDGTGLPYGYVPQWGWNGVQDAPHLVIAEYGLKTPNGDRAAMAVYISDDYGATWDWIYRYPTEANERHIHTAQFIPGTSRTEILISRGDGVANRSLDRLVLSGGEWSAENVNTGVDQPVSMYADASYVYLGNDSAVPPALRFDPTDDTFLDTFQCPTNDDAYTPHIYATRYGAGYGWFVREVGGVYYLSCATGLAEGVWVSDDLAEWVPLYRVSGGQTTPPAVSSAGLHYQRTVGADLGCVYAEPDVADVEWVTSLPSLRNLFTGSRHDDLSYVDISELTATGGWNASDLAHLTVEHSAYGEGMFGGRALKLTRLGSDLTDYVRIASPASYMYLADISDGDVITQVVWVRRSAGWSGTTVALLSTVASDASVNIRQVNSASLAHYEDDWLPLVVHWEILDASSFALSTMSTKLQFADSQTGDHAFYVGGMAAYHMRGGVARDFNGFPPFIRGSVEEKTPTETITTSAAEFTIIFACRPVSGTLNYRAADKKLPICTLAGSTGGSLELYWSNDSGDGDAIYLESPEHGGAGGRAGGATNYSPYPRDVLWLAFRGTANLGTPTGCYTKVTIFDPVNGQTQEYGYDIGDDGSESLFYLNGYPSLLTLGKNVSSGLVGYSYFACIDHQEAILTDSQLAARIHALVNT